MGLVPREHLWGPGAHSDQELQGPPVPVRGMLHPLRDERLLGGCCIGAAGHGVGAVPGVARRGHAAHVAQGAAHMCPRPSQPRCLLPEIWGQQHQHHPHAKGRRRGEELRPPRQGAGRVLAPPGQPHGVTPGSGVRGGKCAAATTPAHSGWTPMHRGSCWNAVPAPPAPPGRAFGARRAPWAPLGCLGRTWHGRKASPSALPVPPPHHGQPLAALPSPAAPGASWLDLRQKYKRLFCLETSGGSRPSLPWGAAAAAVG